MDTAQIKRVTATGDVTTATSYLRSVTVTAGVDAATATVRAGGAAGTVLLVVKAAIGATESVNLGADAQFAGGIHVTVGGTTPDISLVYS